MLHVAYHPPPQGSKMTKEKLSSGDRVRKWRKELAERGGREITVPLEKVSLERLARLKKHYGVPAGEIVSFALVILEKQKRFFDIGSKKSGGKGEDK